MTHTLNGTEIRLFSLYIRTLADYDLVDLKWQNVEWGRDACVALIENEQARRGIRNLVPETTYAATYNATRAAHGAMIREAARDAVRDARSGNV